MWRQGLHFEVSDTIGVAIATLVNHFPHHVSGALLTKESDSSFAEAHSELLSEPNHIEGEVEDQENEVEDERGEECKVESRRGQTQQRMTHG